MLFLLAIQFLAIVYLCFAGLYWWHRAMTLEKEIHNIRLKLDEVERVS